MKAAITNGSGDVWVEDIPMPEPNDYQCLCKHLVCATCTGTDKKHIHNQLPWKQNYPGILGHESIGVVLETGKKVKRYRTGDMVIRPTPVYSGDKFAGFTSLWGGFAEYGLVTDAASWLADDSAATPSSYSQYQLTIPTELGLDPADAAQLITLKEVTGYAHSVGVTLNTSTLLLGAGSVALAFCRGIKLLGAYPLIVAARNDSQLEVAKKIGADFVINSSRQDLREAVLEITGGKGAQRMIDATGSPQYIEKCLAALAEDGKVATYATYPANDPVAQHIPADKLISGKTGEVWTHEYFLSALRHGMVRLDDLYSHRLPLRMISEGFEMISRKEAMKIVFDI
jgi:threonine dehydrogenase-like Zn-dependent dehydrogenase